MLMWAHITFIHIIIIVIIIIIIIICTPQDLAIKTRLVGIHFLKS